MAAAASEPDLEFQALVRAKYAGDSQAMAALGARLVVGREAPFAPVDGAVLIEETARLGDGAAWRHVALLAAQASGARKAGPIRSTHLNARVTSEIRSRTQKSTLFAAWAFHEPLNTQHLTS